MKSAKTTKTKAKKSAKARRASKANYCRSCRRVTKGDKNLCGACATRLGKITDPKADDFDKHLTQLLLNTKAKNKPGLAKKLRQASKSSKDSKSAKIEDLNKEKEMWKKRYRSLEAKKKQDVRRGHTSMVTKTARRQGKRTVSTQAKFGPPEPVQSKAEAKKAATAKNYKSDHAQLKKLLRVKEVTEHLDCLSDVTQEASIKPHRGDKYKALTKAFCDGL